MSEAKSPRPRPMAAEGGGFQGVRKRNDGSTYYGGVDQADREDDRGGNQITVRSRRGAVIIDVAHEGDGVTVSLKPDHVAALISGMGAALAGQDTEGDPVAVRAKGDHIALHIADGEDLIEALIDHEGAAGLIGRLGSAHVEANAA